MAVIYLIDCFFVPIFLVLKENEKPFPFHIPIKWKRIQVYYKYQKNNLLPLSMNPHWKRTVSRPVQSVDSLCFHFFFWWKTIKCCRASYHFPRDSSSCTGEIPLFAYVFPVRRTLKRTFRQCCLIWKSLYLRMMVGYYLYVIIVNKISLLKFINKYPTHKFRNRIFLNSSLWNINKL